MNRRGFLKSIGKVVAGCVVVSSATKANDFVAVDRISDIRAKGMSLEERERWFGPEFTGPLSQMYRQLSLLERAKKQNPRCPDVVEVLSEDNEFIKGMMQDFPVKIHEGLQ